MISSFMNEACALFEERMLELFKRSKGVPSHSPANFFEGDTTDHVQATKQWVQYTFGITQNQLDYHQDFDLPWRAILQKTAKLRT
jgi:hypothetical protein